MAATKTKPISGGVSDRRWWERGIIYQVYPRSFMDSDGDGVGDLAGIKRRLDYLEWLGVDAIWISPIYPSPMADFGYDITNYTDIDPLFGSLEDFHALLAEAHARGLRVILDYVPNHSSDQHPWFLESRSSRHSARRDWYIWRDPATGGGPPTNWLSAFGGSAWEWDEKTGQYYYHAFLKEQPDLNWRNPEVQQALLNVLRFWMDCGVDGFRVDVMHHLLKDAEFRDNPPDPNWRPGMWPYRELLATYTTDLPEVHEIVAMMRQVVEEYKDRMLVGEIYLPVERVIAYYGAAGKGAHLPFNFQLLRLPWQAEVLSEAIELYEALVPETAWPNWVLGNHDNARIATRIGTGQARVAAMLLLTLRGTPTMYYGDEIGMHDVPILPDQVQDPLEKRIPGLGLGRDPERTPMQWTAAKNAGFTAGRPWLPIPDSHKHINVTEQREDPRSMLTLYQQLIALRRSEPALTVGHYAPIPAGSDLLAYVRKMNESRILVVLNFSSEPREFKLATLQCRGSLLISTHLDHRQEELDEALQLRGDEGLVIALK